MEDLLNKESVKRVGKLLRKFDPEFKILVLDSNYNYNVKDISNYDKKICVYHFKGRFKKLINPFYDKYF